MAFFEFHPKERRIHPSLVCDIPALIEAMYQSNERLCLAVCLGFFTGARISEISSLHWNDIDFTKKAIHYRRRAWNKPGTKGSQKGRFPKQRKVPLPVQLGKMLLRFRFGTGWVFPNLQDKHIASETLIRGLRSWTLDNWNYTFTFHDLRHLYASRCLAERENPLLLAKLLGHKNLATTAIYAHFDLDLPGGFYGEGIKEKDDNKENKKGRYQKKFWRKT